MMREIAMQLGLAHLAVGEEVSSAVDAASKFERLGIIGILFLVIIFLGYLYISERRKNEKLTLMLIQHLNATNEGAVSTMVGVQSAVEGFKTTLSSILPFLQATSLSKMKRDDT